jgi:hypothetical protein
MTRTNVVCLKVAAALLSLLAVVGTAVVSTAHAGTVIAGGQADGVSVEAGGPGVYNYDKDGYLFFATVGPNSGANGAAISSFSTAHDSISMPTYISSVSPVALSTEAWGFSYSHIQPTIGNTVESGVAYLTGTPGNEYQLLDIQFGTGPLPSEVRIGVLVNAEPAANQSPTALRLEGPGGVSDSATQIVSHAGTQGEGDLYFFDVAPTPGSVYELFGTAPPPTMFGTNLTIAGLTFATVPEPSSLVGLAGLAAMGLFVVVRRRHGARG